jgi:hypothetical protein
MDAVCNSVLHVSHGLNILEMRVRNINFLCFVLTHFRC